MGRCKDMAQRPVVIHTIARQDIGRKWIKLEAGVIPCWEFMGTVQEHHVGNVIYWNGSGYETWKENSNEK